MSKKIAQSAFKKKKATPTHPAGRGLTQETYRTSISSRGQIVIPVALRRKYGITPKARILISDIGDGILLKVVTIHELVDQLHGSLAGSGTMQEYLAEKAREIAREDADLHHPPTSQPQSL